MAYIAPNTDIILCKGIPFDATYANTASFASAQAAYTYFYSKRYLVLPANSYQRVELGKLRIACTMEQAIQCNYLMFRNTSFENKWFYAFITGWNYVNNITTEITYQIDVFHTFWNDVNVLQVFVEREHSVTDAIGDNLVEENLATGEYLLDGYSFDSLGEDMAIVFWSTFRSEYDANTPYTDPVTGITWNGTWTYFDADNGYWANRCYNGLYPAAFHCTLGGSELINSWIAQMSPTRYESIQSCTLMPWASIQYVNSGLDTYFHDISKSTHFALLHRSDNATIKNNKLYTFPYTFLYVTAFNGVNATYRYEFFNTPNYPDYCEFNIIGDVSPNPSQCAVPLAYKGLGINADEMITLDGFPQISWNTDSFKAWLAQSASSIASVAIGVAGAAVTGGTSLLASAAPVHPYAHRPGSHAAFTDTANQKLNLGGTISDVVSSSGITSVLTGISDLLVGGVLAYMTPPQARGNNGKFLMQKCALNHFGFYNKHILPEYVTIIDDYFNMFGYATRKVKYPNLSSRPYWNYVKTIGKTVDGVSIPEPYLDEINNAFNRGITIWHNPDNVGNYTLDNRPT